MFPTRCFTINIPSLISALIGQVWIMPVNFVLDPVSTGNIFCSVFDNFWEKLRPPTAPLPRHHPLWQLWKDHRFSPQQPGNCDTARESNLAKPHEFHSHQTKSPGVATIPVESPPRCCPRDGYGGLRSPSAAGTTLAIYLYKWQLHQCLHGHQTRY